MILITSRGLVIRKSDKIGGLVLILSIYLNGGILLRLLLIWGTRSIVNRGIPSRKTGRIIGWRGDVVRQDSGMYLTGGLDTSRIGRVIRRTNDRPFDFTIVSLIVIDTLNEVKPS